MCESFFISFCNLSNFFEDIFDIFYQNKPYIIDFNKLESESNLGLFVFDDLERIYSLVDQGLLLEKFQ